MTLTTFRPTRRDFLAGAAGLGAAGLIGARPAFSAEVDWKKFAGTVARGQSGQEPARRHAAEVPQGVQGTDRHQGHAEETPEQQQRQKAVIELTSGKPSFDVVHLSYHVQKRQFEKGGWLADLGGFLKDPALTDADPDGERLLRGRPALSPRTPTGADALAAVLGRLLDRLLEQGAVRRRRASPIRRPSTRWSRPPRR